MDPLENVHQPKFEGKGGSYTALAVASIHRYSNFIIVTYNN